MLTKEMIKLIPTEQLKVILSDLKEEISRRRVSESNNRRRTFINQLRPSDFDNLDEARKAVFKMNSSNILSLRNLNEPYTSRLGYFDALMAQDWSHVYPDECQSGEFYVYAHVNPSARVFIASKKFGGNYGGEPFYIGKGCGNRAYNLKRNQGHGKMIKQCLDSGWNSNDIVKIVMGGISEKKALEIESKLIHFFGTLYEERPHGILLNLEVPKVPEFVGTMTKMFTRKQIVESQ